MDFMIKVCRDPYTDECPLLQVLQQRGIRLYGGNVGRTCCFLEQMWGLVSVSVSRIT